jgi:hypothetical protein
MATQHYELKYRSETPDPAGNDVSSNLNFDYQVFPRIEAQSSTTITSCGNLKFAQKIKQYPVRSAVVGVMIVIVLSVSITCIAVFGKNRNSVDVAMNTDHITTTIIVRFLKKLIFIVCLTLFKNKAQHFRTNSYNNDDTYSSDGNYSITNKYFNCINYCNDIHISNDNNNIHISNSNNRNDNIIHINNNYK